MLYNRNLDVNLSNSLSICGLRLIYMDLAESDFKSDLKSVCSKKSNTVVLSVTQGDWNIEVRCDKFE